MKILYCSLIILAIGFPSVFFGQDNTIRRTFLDDKVQLSIPSNFVRISDKEIALRFPDPKHRPKAVLDEGASHLHIKIEVRDEKLNKAEVGRYKGWLVSKMLKDGSLTVVTHDYKEINGVKVGIVKIKLKSVEAYAHFFFTSLNGQLLVIELDCIGKPDRVQLASFEKIMNSLVIK